MRDNIIKSVIGFNFDLNLVDINDEPIKTGVISTYIENKTFRSSNRLQDKHWFTNFNQALLDQVISYKKENI
jgi:hypothetical protein